MQVCIHSIDMFVRVNPLFVCAYECVLACKHVLMHEQACDSYMWVHYVMSKRAHTYICVCELGVYACNPVVGEFTCSCGVDCALCVLHSTRWCAALLVCGATNTGPSHCPCWSPTPCLTPSPGGSRSVCVCFCAFFFFFFVCVCVCVCVC